VGFLSILRERWCAKKLKGARPLTAPGPAAAGNDRAPSDTPDTTPVALVFPPPLPAARQPVEDSPPGSGANKLDRG
jgi:hypothetical protein